MKTILNYLKQKSTWKGLAVVAGAAGIAWSPEQFEAVSVAVIGLIGLLEVFRNEKKGD